MNQGHHGTAASAKIVLPADAGEALQWFVNSYGLYVGSTRGLFISDWAEERQGHLEAAIINLKSRGFSPLAVTGDTLYKQADYLWKESRANSQFGRPVASQLELDLGGSELVIVDNLEAPENSRHLWYLWAHLLYPRAASGKATIVTTPLSYQEFVKYGEACSDPDYCAKSINWEKLLWLIEASMITIDGLRQTREDGLPPMLKAEHELYTALKERSLDVIPQHVLGDFKLDFALFEKERRLNIEVDTISTLGSSEVQRQEAKRNLMLFSDGWQVLKFTTSEILGNAAACVDVVDDVWRGGRKRGSTGRLLVGNLVPPMPDLPVDDDIQMSAITYGGGPAVVCGGAGTGKTTCVLQRVSYLIGQGVSPENILVLTHGTDTQRALKRSFEGTLEKQIAQRLNVCSWHDLGLKILKENLPAIKRKPPLKVEPSPQKIVQRLLAKVKKEIDPAKLELSVDLDEFYIAAVISMYKSHLITPAEAKQDASNYGEEIIAKIYQLLEDQLLKANRIDRDDVVGLSVQVLLENAELRARYQRQFEFVLVDEYQDITVAQEMLGRLLAAPQDNLFIAGDEEETIHEAKNACPELFTEISLRLPHARCFTLERNWRSHPAIVEHARQLISLLQKRRVQRDYMSAWGQAPSTAIVGPAALADEYDEAQWIASEIQLLADSGRKFGEMAILFRHHVYATIIEEALDQKGVNFRASNPISNFVPDEVEDMLAFLKLIIDPDGPRARESFERVCQLRVKEIDPKLSATINGFAEANNLSYLKAVEIYAEATSDQACADLAQLVRTIRTMHSDKWPPAEAIAQLRRTQRLNEYYRTVKVPAGVNYEPLKKLTQLEEESREFKTIVDFVKHTVDDKQGADAGVQVLPILESKGLEFPIVFMVGMSEGIFPAQTAIDLEEERRICYVGFTRAKELLYVSYPQMFAGAILQPSHFLLEARLMTTIPTQPMYLPQEHVQPMVAHEVPQQYVEPAPMMPVYEESPQQYAEPAPMMPVYEESPQQYAEPAPMMPVYEEVPQQYVEPAPMMPVYEEVPQQYAEPDFFETAPYEEPAPMVAAGASPLAGPVVEFAPPEPVAEIASEAEPEIAPEPVAPVESEPPASRSRPGRRRGKAAEQPAGEPEPLPVPQPEPLFVEPEPLPVPEPMVAAGGSPLEEPAVAAPEPFFAPEPEPIAVPEPVVVPEPQPVALPEPVVVAETEPVSTHHVPAGGNPLEEPAVAAPEPFFQPEPIAVPEPVAAAEPEPVVLPEPVVVAEPEPVATHHVAAGGSPLVADEPVVEPPLAPEPAALQRFIPPPADRPERHSPAAPIAAPTPMAMPEPVVAPTPIVQPQPMAPAASTAPLQPIDLPQEFPEVRRDPATNIAAFHAASKPFIDQRKSEVARAEEVIAPDELAPPAVPPSDTAPQRTGAKELGARMRRREAAAAQAAAAAESPAIESAALPVETQAAEIKPQFQPEAPAAAIHMQPPAETAPAPIAPAAAQTNAPVDPFQVYTADQILQRPSMPSLPKRAQRDQAQPAAEVPAAAPAVAPATPVAPAPITPPPAPVAPAPVTPPPAPRMPVAPAAHTQTTPISAAVPQSLEDQLYRSMVGSSPVPMQMPGERKVHDDDPFSVEAQRAARRQPDAAEAPAARAPVQPVQPQPAAPQPQYQPPQPPSQPYEPTYEQPAPQHVEQPQQVLYAQPQPVQYEQHEYPYAQQNYQPHDMSAGQPLCPACHSPLEPNARFCGECGYTLPQRIPACPTCSSPLEASAKFCGECGVDITGSVAGDSNQISANMVRMQDLKDKQNGWANKIWKMLEQ